MLNNLNQLKTRFLLVFKVCSVAGVISRMILLFITSFLVAYSTLLAASDTAEPKKLDELLRIIREEIISEQMGKDIELMHGEHRIEGYYLSGAPDSSIYICGIAESMKAMPNEIERSLNNMGTGPVHIFARGNFSEQKDKSTSRKSFEILEIYGINKGEVGGCNFDMSRFWR